MNFPIVALTNSAEPNTTAHMAVRVELGSLLCNNLYNQIHINANIKRAGNN